MDLGVLVLHRAASQPNLQAQLPDRAKSRSHRF
jgi:hypothetical protein